jgi:hypothetical protein
MIYNFLHWGLGGGGGFTPKQTQQQRQKKRSSNHATAHLGAGATPRQLPIHNNVGNTQAEPNELKTAVVILVSRRQIIYSVDTYIYKHVLLHIIRSSHVWDRHSF